MKYFLIILSLLSTVVLAEPASEPQTAETAQQAWTRFREAVVRNDIKRIASRTRFPLKLRGVSDSDPEISCHPEDFPAVFEKLLEADAGLSPEPEPLRRYISRHKTLRPANLSGTNGFRVANLVFENMEGRWLLTTAYRDGEEP